ncbi:hypothetical protein Hanom_Chr02g00101021 [Helianthus anomalus]
MNFVVFRTGGFDKKRERKAVSEARRRPFFSTLLDFRHYVQICHYVTITRRQVIARVGFRHCVQILNYLGFRRTYACVVLEICGSADFGIDLAGFCIQRFQIEFGSCLKPGYFPISTSFFMHLFPIFFYLQFDKFGNFFSEYEI